MKAATERNGSSSGKIVQNKQSPCMFLVLSCASFYTLLNKDALTAKSEKVRGRLCLPCSCEDNFLNPKDRELSSSERGLVS